MGCNIHELSGSEKIFYEDQQSARECRISQEVDAVYQEGMERLNSTLNEAREQDNSSIVVEVIRTVLFLLSRYFTQK